MEGGSRGVVKSSKNRINLRGNFFSNGHNGFTRPRDLHHSLDHSIDFSDDPWRLDRPRGGSRQEERDYLEHFQDVDYRKIFNAPLLHQAPALRRFKPPLDRQVSPCIPSTSKPPLSETPLSVAIPTNFSHGHPSNFHSSLHRSPFNLHSPHSNKRSNQAPTNMKREGLAREEYQPPPPHSARELFRKYHSKTNHCGNTTPNTITDTKQSSSHSISSKNSNKNTNNLNNNDTKNIKSISNNDTKSINTNDTKHIKNSNNDKDIKSSIGNNNDSTETNDNDTREDLERELNLLSSLVVLQKEVSQRLEGYKKKGLLASPPAASSVDEHSNGDPSSNTIYMPASPPFSTSSTPLPPSNHYSSSSFSTNNHSIPLLHFTNNHVSPSFSTSHSDLPFPPLPLDPPSSAPSPPTSTPSFLNLPANTTSIHIPLPPTTESFECDKLSQRTIDFISGFHISTTSSFLQHSSSHPTKPPEECNGKVANLQTTSPETSSSDKVIPVLSSCSIVPTIILFSILLIITIIIIFLIYTLIKIIMMINQFIIIIIIVKVLINSHTSYYMQRSSLKYGEEAMMMIRLALKHHYSSGYTPLSY